MSNFTKENDVLVIPNHKGNTVMIRRDSDWFVDMTQLGEDIKKPWRIWKFNNKRVIEAFEKLEQRPLTKVIVTQKGSKKYRHTWVHLVLALRVLADFDHVLSYHIFKHYQQSLLLDQERHLIEVRELRQKIELGEALLAQVEGRKVEPVLLHHDYLAYGYQCNNKCKFGNSFVNSNGSRPKSHKTSVPDLAIGYLIYASKEDLRKLNKAIKTRFQVKGRVEHVSCTIDELTNFVYDYMDLMKCSYIKENIHQLKLLNIFLK